MMNSPALMMLWMTLTVVSTAFTMAGIKQRKLDWALFGLGVGCPTFSLTSPAYWSIGVVLVGLAYWVSRL